MPTPITEQGSDLWFVWQAMLSSFAFVTGAGFDAQRQTQYVVDSKAMRKVGVGEDVIVVGEMDAVLGDGLGIGPLDSTQRAHAN